MKNTLKTESWKNKEKIMKQIIMGRQTDQVSYRKDIQ